MVKKSSVKKAALEETDKDVLIHRMDSAKFKTQWLSAKISAISEINGKNNSFSATIRVKKDSIIWVSITALGIEAARILITKDSLKIVDRLNSKYLVSSMSYLNNTFQMAVDFEMIESLIFANYFSYLDDTKLRSSYVEEDNFILSNLRRRKLKRAMEVKEPNKRIIQDVWLDPAIYRISKMSVDDNKLNKKLIAVYENYDIVDAPVGTAVQYFPYKTTFSVESSSPAKLTYEVSKIVAGKEQEFPFSIPEKYVRMK